MKHPQRSARQAFTLVEMLLVVAVIALLIAMILPALASVRRQASYTLCQTRLRQVHNASTVHASDHVGYFPQRPAGTYMPHNYQGGSFNMNESFFLPYLGQRYPIAFCAGELDRVRNPDVFAGYDSVHTTFQYLNYVGGQWLVPEPKLARSSAEGRYALWTCLTTLKDSGNYLGHDIPELPREPTGQNAARVDGAVEWVPWEQMEPAVLVLAHYFYWPVP